MPKFPEPLSVEELRGIPLEITRLPAGAEVYRIFFSGVDYPAYWNGFRYFGPTASRFDHQLEGPKGEGLIQERGIMYLATGPEAIPTCMAEVFQTSRVIDRHSKKPVLTGFELQSDVHLLDLSGPFATRIGASTAIHSGPRPRARRWSQNLYEAYSDIDGLYYCSSMNGNHPAIALYERASTVVPTHPIFHRLLSDPVLTSVLIETASKIGYRVV
jgi:hypothetical protein